MSLFSKQWTELKLQDIGIKDIPIDQAQITFKSNTLNLKSLGSEIKPENVQEFPSLYWRHDNEKLYTIVCVDPDAPSRACPKNKNWLHRGISIISSYYISE